MSMRRIGVGLAGSLAVIAGFAVARYAIHTSNPPSENVASRLMLQPSIARQAFATFVSDLHARRPATLRLPSPDGNLPERDYIFTPAFTPVPETFVPDRTVGSSTDSTRGVDARVLFVHADELHLSLFTSRGMFTARIRPDAPVVYDQIVHPANVSTPPCEVSEEDEARPDPQFSRAAAQRFARTPHDVNAGAPSRRLKIALAVSDDISSQYTNETALHQDVLQLLTQANIIFKRDLNIELALDSLDIFPHTRLDNETYRQDAASKFFEDKWGPAGHHADLGHLILHASAMTGWAYLKGLCVPGFLATAYSTTPGPVCDGLSSFVHEVGHQLGARHTFNRSDTTRQQQGAYEPGNGRSVMAWTRATPLYFHASSIDAIQSVLSNGLFASQATCGDAAEPVRSPLNGPNVIENGLSHVPPRTAFELSAVADPAHFKCYRWDEYDVASTPDQPPPFFPSDGSCGAFRVYPAFDDLLRVPSTPNWPPSGARLNFRLLAFDNNDASSSKDVPVAIEQGPSFAITAVRCDAPCRAGTTVVVTLDPTGVAATRLQPYNVQTLVAYVLDENGLRRHPVVGSFPNAASLQVPLPQDLGPISHARIVLRANGGVFFAISPPLTIE